jgi:hypothetical protein
VWAVVGPVPGGAAAAAAADDNESVGDGEEDDDDEGPLPLLAAAAAAQAPSPSSNPPPPSVAHILPGPAYLPFYKHRLGPASPYKAAYLETASNAFGAKTLAEWTRRAMEAARAEGRLPPLPPTSTQLQCCVQPLFALAVRVTRPRDFDADRAWMQKVVDDEKGEYNQVDYGEHVEFGSLPLRSTGGADPGADALAADFNAAGLALPPTQDHSHSVVLAYGSGAEPGSGWGVADAFALDPDEHVLTIKEIPLAETVGMRPECAIVVGTAYVLQRGEDFRSKGRLLVFRIATAAVSAGGGGDGSGAAADPNSSSTGGGASVTVPKLRLVYEEDLKGCVTAVAPLIVKEAWVPSGQSAPPGGGKGFTYHAVVATSRRLMVMEWWRGKLRMIAFFDAHTWIRDVVTLKDYIVFGDAHDSIQFLRWRDVDHQLILIAGDVHRSLVASCGVIVHESSLGMVVADAEGNVQVLAFAPGEHRTRLLVRADFHLGSGVDRLVRSRLAFPLGVPLSGRRSYGAFFGTYGGAVGALVPLDEMTFKRLLMLQRVLTYCLPHAAGLNPKLWRQYDSRVDLARPVARNFLDGPLLWRYLGLTTHSQRQFAESIGSSAERVLANLRHVDASAAVF